LKTLDYVVKQFNANDIPYWLTYGTLLGAVRNNKIIPWDEDIDLGILVMDLPAVTLLSQKFQKAGFGWNVGVRTDNFEVGKINVFSSLVNSLHVDISIYDYDMVGDVRFVKGVFWPSSTTRLDNVLPPNLVDIEFEGKMYKSPANPEELLNNFYGDNCVNTPKVKAWIKERILKDPKIDPHMREILVKANEYKWEPGRCKDVKDGPR
jgi:hypothetical protein